MKKFISIFLIFALFLPVCAIAENNVHEYSLLLDGKWNSAGYTGVPGSSKHCCTLLDYFIYPGQNDATVTIGVAGEPQPTKTTTALLGDETGEVYLFITDSRTKNMTVGRVMFSENGRIMMLLCADGASFLFVKEE